MKIILEKHKYAPELNKAYIKNNIINCPSITSISDFRKKYFKPIITGKYGIIFVSNKTHPCINRKYEGYFKDYLSLKGFLKQLKKKHCLENTEFKIITKLVG